MNNYPLFDLYISGDNRVSELIGGSFRELADRKAAADRAAKQSIAPAILDAIRKTNANLSPSFRREENIRALSEGGAVVAVTGQQTGLGGGPLYTFYKALSTVIVSEQLAQETGKRVIPIFWLQTEDHNFEEVRTLTLPNIVSGEQSDPLKTFSLTAELPTQSRVSVAYKQFHPSDSGIVPELERLLASYPGAADALSILRETVKEGGAISESFKTLLGQLFANDGLVFFDPRSFGVAPIASAIFQSALVRHEEIANALVSRVIALHDLGVEEQVKINPGSLLFFIHKDSPDGPRFRLERDSSSKRWHVPEVSGLSFSIDELMQLIRQSPERFSTSALLRPVLQASLLPTAAHITGPAEVAYLTETAPLFPLFNMQPPLVVPRGRFVLVEPKFERFLSGIGLSVPEFLSRKESEIEEAIATHFAPEDAGPEKLERDTAVQLEGIFSKLEDTLGATDPTLRGAVKRMAGKTTEQLTTLIGRYRKALTARFEVENQRIKRVTAFLRPNGEEQERVLGAIYFVCRYGEEYLKTILREAYRPWSGTREIVMLNADRSDQS